MALIGAAVVLASCTPSNGPVPTGERDFWDRTADFLRSLMPRSLLFIADEQQDYRVLRGHTDRVWAVAFSPDGKTLASGGDAKAAAYLECAVDGRVLWGVGIHSSIVTASLKAVVSALNRADRDAAAS